MFEKSENVQDVNPDKVANLGGNQPLLSGDYAIVGMTLHSFVSKKNNETVSFYVLVLARVDKDNKIIAQADTVSVKQLASPVPEIDTDGKAHYNTGSFQKRLAELFDGKRTLTQVTLQALNEFKYKKFSVNATVYNKINRNGDIVLSARYATELANLDRLDFDSDVRDKIGKMFTTTIYAADSQIAKDKN